MTLFGVKAAIAALLVLSMSSGSAASSGEILKSQPPILQPQNSDPNQSSNPGIILANPGEVTLYWTAPGDDGNIGIAHQYFVRYSSNIITESNWGTATVIPNPPAPLLAGTGQNFTFTGLTRGMPYYFAIKTYDEAGNASALSNVLRKFAGGIVTPSPRPAFVDSIQGIATLSADTVAAAKRLIYQFAVDTTSAFPAPVITIDSLIHSPVIVSYTNLRRNDTYYWRVRAIFQDRTDTSLWSTTNAFYMPIPPDIIPPVLSNIVASGITEASALIGWQSNEPATSQVDYGTTIGYGFSTILDPALVSSHLQTLTGLNGSTTYHYRVKSRDAAGNLATSGDFAFTTAAGLQLLSVGLPDTVCGTYPGYSIIRINDGIIAPRGGTGTTWASDQSATQPHWVMMTFNSPKLVQRVRIYWAFNIYNSSWMCSRQYSIQYWNAATNSYQNAAVVNNSTVDSATTTNFTPVTTTKIRYWQPANMGPPNYASILWLTELQIYGNNGDITPPILSNIRATEITSSSANIRWDSNEPATSQVDYGTTTGYGFSTSLDTALVTGHVQALTGLAGTTAYHYRVRSMDAAGNQIVSGDFTFTTLSSLQLLSVGLPDTVCGTYSGYSIIRINDGVIAPRGGTSTTWASDQDATQPHWVMMTFSAPVTVQRVRIYWASNSYNSSWMCSRQYSIQYWNTATNSYQNAAVVNNSTVDSVTTTDFTSVTTTKIRYWQPANMGPPNYASILWLTEFQIYGNNPPGGPLSEGGGLVDNLDIPADSLPLAKPNSLSGLTVPTDYFLGQCYPNPFNAVTRIEYGLPEAAYVTFSIYDIMGRLVATLEDGYQEAGYHGLTWNAGSEPSGIYLYRLKAGEYAQTRKMTVVK